MTSPARRRALLAYLQMVRDRMRLQAWDLSISTEAAQLPNSVLEVKPHAARHHGSVRVGAFFGETRTEQRQAVVHELVHLIQADLFEYFEDGTAQAALRPAGLEWITQRVFAEMEIQADAVARLVAPGMPLPPAWPK